MKHWPEYLGEALGLGLFMVSAGLVATALDSPRSPVQAWIADADLPPPGAFFPWPQSALERAPELFAPTGRNALQVRRTGRWPPTSTFT